MAAQPSDVAPTTAPPPYDLYPPRNLMDEIVPGLYLGSLDAATDHELLAKNKITHILSLTSSALPKKPPKNIHHTHHIVRDVKTSNLMEILLSSLKTLEDAFTGVLPILDDDGQPVPAAPIVTDNVDIVMSGDPNSTTVDGNGKRTEVRVFVHCRMGISRSASVVLAYLLKHRPDLCPSLTDSIRFLRSRRSCINPNRGFRAQLEILSSVHFDIDVVRELGLLDLGGTLENVWDPEEETGVEEREAKRRRDEDRRRRWKEKCDAWDRDPSFCRLQLRGWAEKEEDRDMEEWKQQEEVFKECIRFGEEVARRARHMRRQQEELDKAAANMAAEATIPGIDNPLDPIPTNSQYHDYFPSIIAAPIGTPPSQLREAAQAEWNNLSSTRHTRSGIPHVATNPLRLSRLVASPHLYNLRLQLSLTADELHRAKDAGKQLEAAITAQKNSTTSGTEPQDTATTDVDMDTAAVREEVNAEAVEMGETMDVDVMDVAADTQLRREAVAVAVGSEGDAARDTEMADK